MNAILMQEILKIETITILSAENGEAALQLAANRPEIALVLMNIKMPVMNSFEATREIK